MKSHLRGCFQSHLCFELLQQGTDLGRKFIAQVIVVWKQASWVRQKSGMTNNAIVQIELTGRNIGNDVDTIIQQVATTNFTLGRYHSPPSKPFHPKKLPHPWVLMDKRPIECNPASAYESLYLQRKPLLRLQARQATLFPAECSGQ